MSIAIIDTCSLINLIRSGGASTILRGISIEVWFQGLVEDEIVLDKPALDDLVEKGLLHKFDGSGLSATFVGTLAGEHEIGVGEAECLAVCVNYGTTFISDDRKARSVAQHLLGTSQVIGVIGLLCKCIDIGVIDTSQAMVWLYTAQSLGGFLPNFDFNSRQLVA